jgi:hypothetical protein
LNIVADAQALHSPLTASNLTLAQKVDRITTIAAPHERIDPLSVAARENARAGSSNNVDSGRPRIDPYSVRAY